MNERISELIDRIAALGEEWHGIGVVNSRGLRAIAELAETVGPIERSVETGSGATTLLFSHLSNDHRAFALDCGDSVGAVRRSPLFRSETVTYVEGPTQLTLPGYRFPGQVQIALIDGPHGYPFPDLEYYYLYPLVQTGGLLIVDDIQIPTIGRMFDILQADDMFELETVVNRNMAFFRRTRAPLIDPLSDSWWLQGYNRDHYQAWQASKDAERAGGDAAAPASPSGARSGSAASRALTGLAGLLPESLRRRIPATLRRRLRGLAG